MEVDWEGIIYIYTPDWFSFESGLGGETDPENSRPRVFWLPVTCCFWVLGWATTSIFGYLWIEVKHSAFSELIPVSIMMKAGCYDGWCSWCGGWGWGCCASRTQAMGVQSDMEIVQMVGIQRKYLETLMISLQECHAARLEIFVGINSVNSNLVVGLVVWIVLKPGHTSYFNWKDPELRKRTSSHRKLPWISSLPRSRWSQARGRSKQSYESLIWSFFARGALW